MSCVSGALSVEASGASVVESVSSVSTVGMVGAASGRVAVVVSTLGAVVMSLGSHGIDASGGSVSWFGRASLGSVTVSVGVGAVGVWGSAWIVWTFSSVVG